MKRGSGHRRVSGKWSKSVAQLMEDQGKFIPNEKLSKDHVKMKKPHLFKK